MAAARWLNVETHITGSLAAWRACFPGARAANVERRCNLADADFARLAGVEKLRMWGCTWIADAGVAHLRGTHTPLDMSYCTTNAGLAHLAGIHTLDMRGCTGITDAPRTGLRTISLRH